jgi:hypothetical protein
MFDYFAPFFNRAIFIRAIFIPNLLKSHLTKVKESRVADSHLWVPLSLGAIKMRLVIIII